MRILYILTSYNLYGGTPKKTLDLLKSIQSEASLYLYGGGHQEFKYLFEETNANIYEGYYKRDIFKHIKALLEIIDRDKIDIIQTQFSFGELLGVLLKRKRANIKLVVSFETPFRPEGIRRYILPRLYSQVDRFIYISNYVKEEKEKSFPILKERKSEIIFNGTEKIVSNIGSSLKLKPHSLLDISALSDWKNIQILIDMMNILVNTYNRKDIHLYIAGDGEERNSLELKIREYKIEENTHLLGYQTNVVNLLREADLFVHPSYKEGFGIVVVEAMIEAKPIIVSNAGALPEIIEDGVNGFLVNPFDANQWAKRVLMLIDNSSLSKEIGLMAEKVVKEKFSIEQYIYNHKKLYKELMEES